MGAGMSEPEEYIEILKEQLEEKSRLIQSLTELVILREEQIFNLKELLKGNSRSLGD